MSNEYQVQMRDQRQPTVTADGFQVEDGNYVFYTGGEKIAAFNCEAVQYVARRRPEGADK